MFIRCSGIKITNLKYLYSWSLSIANCMKGKRRWGAKAEPLVGVCCNASVPREPSQCPHVTCHVSRVTRCDNQPLCPRGGTRNYQSLLAAQCAAGSVMSRLSCLSCVVSCCHVPRAGTEAALSTAQLTRVSVGSTTRIVSKAWISIIVHEHIIIYSSYFSNCQAWMWHGIKKD